MIARSIYQELECFSIIRDTTSYQARTKIPVSEKQLVIDISFEINGKKVNPRNVADALEVAILTQVADSVKRSLGSLRCATHHKAPTIKVKGRNLNKLSFEISGCCDELIEQATKRLK